MLIVTVLGVGGDRRRETAIAEAEGHGLFVMGLRVVIVEAAMTVGVKNPG
jgi:hypothetical protein